MVTKPAGFRQSAPLSHDDAVTLTFRIADKLELAYEGIAPLILEAFHGRAWVPMEYTSWAAYCEDNFTGAGMLRLPDDIVDVLAGEGMSTRSIAAATGRSKSDVDRHMNKRNRPDNVTSLDSRRRPATRTPAESRAAHPAGKDAPYNVVGEVTLTTTEFPAWFMVVSVVADAGWHGATYVDVCDALGWRDGKVTGALSEASRRGEIRTTVERDGHAVWTVVPE